MPAQPAWFQRLDKILTAPRSMTSTHLDRSRRQLAAHHVRIPAAAEAREHLLGDLSAGIALRPGATQRTARAPGGSTN